MRDTVALDQEQTGLIAIVSAVATGVGGLFLWLSKVTLGRDVYQNAINEGFKGLLTQLRDENRVLRENAGKASRERQQLLGEIRQLQQQIRSLNTLLESAGIKLPQKEAYSNPKFDHELEDNE